jgi:hypothetical protein
MVLRSSNRLTKFFPATEIPKPGWEKHRQGFLSETSNRSQKIVKNARLQANYMTIVQQTTQRIMLPIC